MRTHARITIAAMAALLALSVAGADPATYAPPFTAGPSGGDAFNYRSVDPQGRITVLRAYPQPGAFNCGGAGGWATFVVSHPASGSEGAVGVLYADAVWDGYTWLTVLVRDGDGSWLGSAQVRGPGVGDGTMIVELDRAPAAGTQMTIQFGIQVASACPNVNGGTARFTAVSVA